LIREVTKDRRFEPHFSIAPQRISKGEGDRLITDTEPIEREMKAMERTELGKEYVHTTRE
jgi:hypothetical protein